MMRLRSAEASNFTTLAYFVNYPILDAGGSGRAGMDTLNIQWLQWITRRRSAHACIAPHGR
jgi:hypothetical protein